MNVLIKLLSIFIIPILCGILGALTGAGAGRYYRVILIPIILTTIFYITQHNLLGLILLGIILPLTIGYGIPCWCDPDPSWLGKFWYNKILYAVCYSRLKHWNILQWTEAQIEKYANIPTRSTIGLLICLFCLIIPILKHNWIVYTICSKIIISIFALLSWRNLGVYKLFNKQLLWSETITYGLITLFILIIIYY